MNWRKLHILIGFFYSFISLAQTDDVKIELGKKNLLIDEKFIIKVIIKNSNEWNVNQFPLIQGFSKESKQVAHSQAIEAGKKVAIHTITQTYLPTKEGNFRIPAFPLVVNGKEIFVENFTLTVTVPKDPTAETPKEVPVTAEQAKSQAFLSLETNKNSVFVGEGFRLTLTFYLAENSTANIEFTDDKDLNAQIDAIAKKLKPADCLEERVTITDIKPSQAVIAGKKFAGYKVFEATYYPINAKPINLPAVELKMRLKKTKTTEEILNFSSKPISISIKELPEHPQKDKVTVGDFRLVEQIETRKIHTGKTFNYSFKIVGEGNFSTISLGNIQNDSHFDFFSPIIKESNGQKEFRFRIMPKDSGQHSLGNYFDWVFFNTKKNKYDTLKSKLNVKVSGGTIEDTDTNSEDIYAGIEKVSTATTEVDYKEIIKSFSNIALVIMLIGSIFLFNYKKNQRNH